MAKLGSILERQFKKLGIEITDDLKALIELDTEVTDDVASKIDKGLLTIEAAKSNPDVNKLLKAQILAGVDTQIEEIIKEHGVTVGDDFVNEKNTYQKVPMLSKLLLETGRKKAEANSKEGVSEVLKKEREQFAAKEADYNKKLSELTTSLTTRETEFKSTRENDLTSFELQKLLFGKDYVFPKEMDSSLKVKIALDAINKDLVEKGLIAKRNEAGSLVITDKEGNKAYTDKHEPIENPHSYFDGVLTQNKLLNINDPSKQQQQQSSGSNGAQGGNFIQNGQGQQGNQAIVAEIESQLYK